MIIKAWATKGPDQPLEPYTYDPGPLTADDVEIAVENCGLCHSDVSVMNNEWGISSYPAIPGHEIIGRVVALGAASDREVTPFFARRLAVFQNAVTHLFE